MIGYWKSILMNIIKLKFIFTAFRKAAAFLVKDKKSVLVKVQEGALKASAHKGDLTQVWGQLQLLFSVAKDYANGSYTMVPKRSIVAIVAGLLYFISPLDFLPDLIPGLGFIDDVYILTLVFKQVSKDLEHYKAWKKAGQNIIQI